ncbi:MAG: phosphoribosylpyrophosphate synthetase [Fimbriimonadaceae bacterium]|nr:phosphoribosylpyrophosphate synthetase [Chitinophagales bacterium]
MVHYANLPEAINGLRKLGYTLDYATKDDCLECTQNGETLSPDKFEIDKVYRFEADSDPENQSILYAISSVNGHKGLLVNSFGIYSDPMSDALIAKLKIRHDEQNLIK